MNGTISYSSVTEQPFDLGTVASHECGFAHVGPEFSDVENGRITYSPTPGDGDTTIGVGN